MTKSAMFAAVFFALITGCAGDDQTGWGDPSSTCQPICKGDGPCDESCADLVPGIHELQLVSVSGDGTAEPPALQVFTSELADAVLDSYDGAFAAVPVELTPDSFVIVETEDGSCVMPAARGLLTCVTPRYEVVLQLL